MIPRAWAAGGLITATQRSFAGMFPERYTDRCRLVPGLTCTEPLSSPDGAAE
jgi:hypothetical protein